MAKKPKVAPRPFTPARVRKLAKDPGTRSTIPTRLLPQQYRQARELNARLDAPVAPGSGLTGRQLGRDTKSYITQKYGMGDQAEQQGIRTQQQLNTDTTGWYDKYLQDLRTHAANINTFADQNVAQTQGAGQGIASVAQQALAGQSDPVSQGINAQAADTRQRYAGSFVGQASAVGTANKNYASTVANVVGPGQKLQAQVQGGRALTTLREKAATRADVKGADAQSYRSGRITEEQKIAAADAIARGKSVTSITTAKIRSDTAKSVARTNAASKTPPVPYYTWAQWKSMTPAQKRAAVKDYQKKPGSPKGKPKVTGKGFTSSDGKVRSETASAWLRTREVWATQPNGQRKVDSTGQPSKETVPITPAFVKKNRQRYIDMLVQKGLSTEGAARIVDRYIGTSVGNAIVKNAPKGKLF